MKFLTVVVCMALLWSVCVVSVAAIDTPWLPLEPDSEETDAGDETTEVSNDGGSSVLTEETDVTSKAEETESDTMRKTDDSSANENSKGCESVLDSQNLVLVALIVALATMAKSESERRKENA